MLSCASIILRHPLKINPIHLLLYSEKQYSGPHMAGGPMKVGCQAAKRLTDGFTAPMTPSMLPCSDIHDWQIKPALLPINMCPMYQRVPWSHPGPANCVDTETIHSTTFNDSFTVPHRMWQSWNHNGWLLSNRPSKRPLYTTICRYNSHGLCCVFKRKFELCTKFDNDSAIK